MRNGNRHMKRNGYKMNEVRVGLSEIKELSKSSVKATRAITRRALAHPSNGCGAAESMAHCRRMADGGGGSGSRCD